MKKILFSLLVSLCFIPLMVFATIDSNTKGEYKLVSTDGSTASTRCSGEEANNNSGLDKASSGYYLYCIQITCTSSKNAHSIAHPFASSVTCANGNKDPELTI